MTAWSIKDRLLRSIKYFICILISLAIILSFSSRWLYVKGQAMVMPQTSAVSAPSYPDVPLPASEEINSSVSILMYHFVMDDELYQTGRWNGNNAVITVSSFTEQMSWLKQNGYNTIFMSELLSYLRQNRKLPPKTVVITFDDGYQNSYGNAMPILQENGLKANIAVIVKDSLDDDDIDLSTGTLMRQPHLTFAQMKEMLDSGVFEIGSHSYNSHALFIDSKNITRYYLTDKLKLSSGQIENDEEYLQRITKDLRLSRNILESRLGEKVIYFAYPFGANNEKVISTLKNTGYAIATITKKGRQPLEANSLYTLKRYNIDANDTLSDFIAKVEGKTPDK